MKENEMEFEFSKISYAAKLEKVSDEYLVIIPDIPEIVSGGRNVYEAKQNAKQTLSDYIIYLLRKNRDIPESRAHKYMDKYFMISPYANVLIKLYLINLWRESKISKSRIAKAIQKDEKVVRRALDPSYNAEIKTMEDIIEFILNYEKEEKYDYNIINIIDVAEMRSDFEDSTSIQPNSDNMYLIKKVYDEMDFTHMFFMKENLQKIQTDGIMRYGFNDNNNNNSSSSSSSKIIERDATSTIRKVGKCNKKLKERKNHGCNGQ